MKIGVLTYPLNNNYGCYLQSYALIHFLQEKGYDVEYIYRRHDKPSRRFYIKYAIKSIVKGLLFNKWQNPWYNYEWDYMLKNGKNMIPFFEKYIVPHTKAFYTTKELKKQCKKYDVVIVGSDQVWRADILSNIEDYFLPFIDGNRVRKIAYAASFGKDNPGYTDFQIKKCGEALKAFTAVSVREKIGEEIIGRYGWECMNYQVVLDPTMILPVSSYLSLINEPRQENRLFGYILDQSEKKKKVLDYIACKYNMKAINFLEDVKTKGQDYPSVEMWLESIYSSKIVLTDSFHGAVFSIIFNKPFIIMVNENRGAARFDTLLETFNLKHRILSDVESVDKLLFSPIDWESVNETLRIKKEKSVNFLLKYLDQNRNN